MLASCAVPKGQIHQETFQTPKITSSDARVLAVLATRHHGPDRLSASCTLLLLGWGPPHLWIHPAEASVSSERCPGATGRILHDWFREAVPGKRPQDANY